MFFHIYIKKNKILIEFINNAIFLRMSSLIKINDNIMKSIEYYIINNFL